MRLSTFAASYALDWLVGDPQWLPHPVRVIGSSIGASERAARTIGSGKRFELAAGSVIAIGIPAASHAITWIIVRRAHGSQRFAGFIVEAWLASSCLATRNLLDETMQVLRAIEDGNIDRARMRLARIVGRDTDHLDESEICRAVIETLAESLCDGIIAPLFYLALGGAPLAMAYKAVNTLDSMIGHRDQQYLYFGRAAARLDDAANWLPARATALLICAAAATDMGARSSLQACQTWRRDGALHASPNAGQVESAMAGALGVRLGGENTYDGERISSPRLGNEFAHPDRAAARRAVKIVATASLLGFGLALLFLKGHRND